VEAAGRQLFDFAGPRAACARYVVLTTAILAYPLRHGEEPAAKTVDGIKTFRIEEVATPQVKGRRKKLNAS
jgi:hypothetical protein